MEPAAYFARNNRINIITIANTATQQRRSSSPKVKAFTRLIGASDAQKALFVGDFDLSLNGFMAFSASLDAQGVPRRISVYGNLDAADSTVAGRPKAVVKTRALQTLRDLGGASNLAKRLECGRLQRRFGCAQNHRWNRAQISEL